MNWAKTTFGAGFVWLICLAVSAQERAATLLPPTAVKTPTLLELAQVQGGKEKKKDDKTQPPKLEISRPEIQTAEAPPAPSFNMIGEQYSSIASLVTITVPSLAKVDIGDGQIIDIPFNARRTVRVLAGGRTGYKVGENEFVLPQDRVFFTYNFYDNVRAPGQGIESSQIVSQMVPLPGQPPRTFSQLAAQQQQFPANIYIPGVANPHGEFHRETIGFEKTFLDGDFSFGVRVPFFQQNGFGEFSDRDMGDMTFIFKYAPYFDRQSGSGISTGMAVTIPTGPSIHTVHGNIDSTILQPFLGYQFDMDRLLVFGFSSLAIPTDTEDVLLLFNDIGIGYRIFDGNGGRIRSIVPALEAHVTTPLNHRAVTDTIQGFDVVVLTGGLHIGLGDRGSLLTIGVATPVTGPRLFDVEAIVQFNLRF